MDIDDVMREAVEAAVWAPSVHNTQPWWFGTRVEGPGGRISLHADHDRRLAVADPEGREMMISCGAALATLKLALQSLGRRPEVRLLPEPDRPGLIADVRFGPSGDVTPEVKALAARIRERHTHRGPFPDAEPNPWLLATLTAEARHEGAHLRFAPDAASRDALAAVSRAAEHVRRLDDAYSAELNRWTAAPVSDRRDGVPARRGSCGQLPPPGWLMPFPAEAGAVATLATRRDTRADWLAAGQALQRVLLRAATEGYAAAIHTQALELPELRDFVRARLCAGLHPQLLLRFGEATPDGNTVRRDPAALTTDEP